MAKQRVRAKRQLNYLLPRGERDRHNATHDCVSAGAIGTIEHRAADGEIVVAFGSKTIWCDPEDVEIIDEQV